MKKAKTRSFSSSSKRPTKSIKTEPTLSNGICQNAFFNYLRTDGPNGCHAETKMTFVPIKVNQRKVPVSHIFTGEDPSTIKVTRKSAIKYTPSNVLFNDDYFEKNPQFYPSQNNIGIQNAQNHIHIDISQLNFEPYSTRYESYQREEIDDKIFKCKKN